MCLKPSMTVNLVYFHFKSLPASYTFEDISNITISDSSLLGKFISYDSKIDYKWTFHIFVDIS